MATDSAQMPGEGFAGDGGECLVQAKAQLMTRDTDTCLWSTNNTFVVVKLVRSKNKGVSGGSADVDLNVDSSADTTKAASEYRIEGHNISDGNVSHRSVICRAS